MIRFCVIVFFALAAALVVAETTVYQTVGSDGVPHFSDEAKPGAKKIELQPAQVFEAPELKPEADTDVVVAIEAPERHYHRVLIVVPRDEETLWDNHGHVNVSVDLEPALFPGDTLRLLLDGKVVLGPQKGRAFTLRSVDRGKHTLQVQVMRGNRVVTSSAESTLYLQKTSVHYPARRSH